MAEADNTKMIQDCYAAFGRGDVQAILDQVDDNVDWQAWYGAGKQVPFGGHRHGKAAVSEFFKQIGQHMNFSRLETRDFVATGDKVVVLGHYTGKTSAGKAYDSDFAMVFTVRNGKVTHFQEFSDSAGINAAF
jgi:ketosteroid isomerase-like protein